MPFFDIPCQEDNDIKRGGWRPICDCELDCLHKLKGKDCIDRCEKGRLNPTDACVYLYDNLATCRAGCKSDENYDACAEEQSNCVLRCDAAFIEHGDGFVLGDCLAGCHISGASCARSVRSAAISCLSGCELTVSKSWSRCALKAAETIKEQCDLSKRWEYQFDLARARSNYVRCVPYATYHSELTNCSIAYETGKASANLNFAVCVNTDGSDCTQKILAELDRLKRSADSCNLKARSTFGVKSATCLEIAHLEIVYAQTKQFARDDRLGGSTLRWKRFRFDRSKSFPRGDARMSFCMAFGPKAVAPPAPEGGRSVSTSAVPSAKGGEGVWIRKKHRITWDLITEKITPAAAQSQTRTANLALLADYVECHWLRCERPDKKGANEKVGGWLYWCLSELKRKVISGERVDFNKSLTACHNDYDKLGGCDHLEPRIDLFPPASEQELLVDPLIAPRIELIVDLS